MFVENQRCKMEIDCHNNGMLPTTATSAFRSIACHSMFNRVITHRRCCIKGDSWLLKYRPTAALFCYTTVGQTLDSSTSHTASSVTRYIGLASLGVATVTWPHL